MKTNTKHYDKLREYLETVPLVDCHDHTIACEPKYTDPISVVASGYFASDLQSASSNSDIAIILDPSLSVEERWPILEKAWKRTCHTGYAQVTKRVLKKFYNEDELTLDGLKRMQSKLANLEDEKTFDDILEEANIAARLEDVLKSDLVEHVSRIKEAIDGSFKLSPRGRLIISLPDYHNINCHESVQLLAEPAGKMVTNLDEYLSVCREIFEGCKKFGAVAFKDQCAYTRSLEFGNPTRSEAEKVFNWFMSDPRRRASYPDGVKPLDDYLFHEFMRMARDMDLPVQIHTGHMAGIRNDIVKTNAIGLRSVIELHPDVRFDLFHANWPYSGELLFMGKNYPNVTIDFCWANIIDPIYCQNMFKQALSSVPHGKIHGYGSDFSGQADRAWAHASIARDNIAIALSDMVEIEYLDIDEAKQVGYDWLFGNANKFFRLNL
jgi:uncharacterized protein